MVVHIFNPSNWEAKASGSISMFKATLVYSVNCRTVRDTEKSCVQRREEKNSPNQYIDMYVSWINQSNTQSKTMQSQKEKKERMK